MTCDRREATVNHTDREERELILRDKIAREGFSMPDDVIGYLADQLTSPNALKAELINVSAYASRRGVPITLELARLVVEGVRPGSEDANAPAEPDSAPGDGDLSAADMDGFGVTLDADSEALEPAYESEEPAEGEGEFSLFDEDEYQASAQGVHEYDAPAFTQGTTSTTAWGGEEWRSEPEAAAAPVAATPEPHAAPAATAPIAGTTTFVAASPITAPQASSPLIPQGPAATVWFVPVRTERKRSLIERVGTALKRAGLEEVIAPGDKVAVKVHFGEKGNTGFVSPIYAREVVRLIKELGGKPFLTDANTLYSGQRANSIDHLECALANGFSYATVGAPLIIADGLNGQDGVDIPLAAGKHCETVKIGSQAVYADAMVVISHVKGHGEAGFGGAMKNVGMGLGTRSAKQRMHSDVKPVVKPEACTRCGRCVEWCPVSCIDMGPTPVDKAIIDSEHCIGCGECVAACAHGAIAINWSHDPSAMQEKIVEHVVGALDNKRDKSIFVSFLTNITPECDCWSFSDAPIVPDIGVLASRDIIAIDQASYDMVTEAVGNAHSEGEGLASGADKFEAIHGIDGQIAMSYGEELGLGTRTYEIRRIG